MKRVYTNQEIERLFWAEKEGLPSRLVVWVEAPGKKKEGDFQTLISLAGKVPAALELEKIATSFDPAITITDITMCKLLSEVEVPSSRTVTEEVLRALAVYAAPLNWGSFSYGEVRDLLSAFRTWEEGNRQDVEKENVQRELINSIERKLREVESRRVAFEGVEAVASSTGFEPVYRGEDGQIPRPSDAMDIFDKIVVSETLPYAQYRGENGVFYYKVFKGRGVEELPNLEAIILNSAPHDVPYLEVGIPSNTAIEPDTIYMSLWLGQGRMQDATKSTFHQVTYDLRENTLAVEAVIGVETQDMERARGRLEAAFPHLSLGPEKEVKVRGEFYVAIDLDETVLYHLVLNSWLANIFYAEESTRPAALKRRLTLNYRSLFYEELRLRSKKTGGDPPPAATVSLFTQSGRPGVYKAVIGRTRNNEHLQDFLNVFSLALAYYLDRKEEISALYYSMVPELAEISKLALLAPPDQGVERAKAVGRAKKKLQRGVTNIKQLQEKFGKFTLSKNFSRDCQGEHQPEIVPPEELEAARKETFLAKETIGGRIYKEIAPRQILPFPNAQNPQVHLICRSDRFPYPGMTPNKDEATRKEYPCIFCCYENDQTSKKRYIQCANMKESVIRAANSYIVSGKMLQERQFGTVPPDILQLLGGTGQLERPDRRAIYSERLNRYGVVRSPNSFLHCILRAVGDAEYNLAITKGAEERTVLNLRRELSQYLRQFPDLVRQELYDREDSEIFAELDDPEAFLDPLLYYRLVEEFFNINVFVFSNEGKGNILVPRFKLFRAQVKQMRYSALVIRNKGAESDKLTYPQCELIVGRQEGEDTFSPVALFDEDEAGKACYQALVQACRVFSFTPYSYPITDIHSIPRYLSIPTPEVQALIPGYEEGTSLFFNTAPAYEADFPGESLPARKTRGHTFLRPVSQVVDSSGKLRALIFRLKDGSLFSIITFPSQPGALPRHTGPLPRLSASKTVAVLGQPLFYKAHGEIEIDGVTVDWVFGLCYKNAFHPDIIDYVPVDDVEDGPYRPADLIDYLRPEEADFQLAPLFDRSEVEEGVYSNFLESEPEIPRSMTERIRHLTRTMKLILALVRWLYEIEKARGVDEPRLFAESFLRYVDAPVKDSADFYNFKRLRPRLPPASSALEAVRLMSNVAPSFFTPEGFLLMYSREMYRRVASYIFDYHRKTFSLHGNPPLYIEDFFTQSEDFTPYPGVAVFCGTQMLHEWLKSLRVSYEIREKVDFSLAMVLSPSLYLAPPKVRVKDKEVTEPEAEPRDFYIVQSVAVSGDATGAADLAAALYLAAAWEKNGENLGAEIRIASADALSPEEIAQAFADYTVFKIGADSQLEEIQRVGAGRLKILRFLTGKASEDENLTTLNYTEGARRQASFFAALLPIRDR